jgi:hypothetical protein
MASQLSLLDMRELNGALASTHYPGNVDSAIVSERLRKYVQRFGHSMNTRKISLRHDKTVAVEDFAYSLWTYEADNTTHFAFAVSNDDKEYFSCYSNCDFSAYFGDDGLPIEQFAQWDRLRFTERATILSSYRDLVAVNTRKSSDRFAVALMIWYLHRMLYPGPLEEVVATLTSSQAIAPKDIDSWGLLGIVQYRLGNLDAANEAIQRALKNALAPLATATNAWLDTFADGNHSDEAAAFLYLLEAAEELQN